MRAVLSKRAKRPIADKGNVAEARRSAENTSAQTQAPAPATRLGNDLTAAREKINLTVGEVAQATRISHRHIQSLEEGRYSDLPGGMYNRAFLRSYCKFLGLDPEPFLNRYEEESTPISEKAARTKARTAAVSAESLRFPPVLLWSIMLLASVAGLYFSRHWIRDVFSPYFSHPPATMLPQSPAAPQPAPAKTPETAAADATAATTPQPLSAGAVPPEPAAAPQVAAPPPVSDIAPGTLRLEFTAEQECWVSVRMDGTSSRSILLRQGETQTYDAKESFFVILGNAGGVSLKINGKPARALGAPGEVIRMLIDEKNIVDLLAKL